MRATRRARSSLPALVRADSFTAALQPGLSVVEVVRVGSDAHVTRVLTIDAPQADNARVERVDGPKNIRFGDPRSTSVVGRIQLPEGGVRSGPCPCE